MIQIESVHIEELRGIRDLTLDMQRSTYVISGPNGSGKSGVVDAIQFALTGEIGRLTGKGTGELTLSEHAPHVDHRDDPGAAFVRLTGYLPRLGKSVTLTRTVKRPHQPVIEPGDPEIVAELEEIARHSELTLSRREIIKFILAEPTSRSRAVQSLLKLDAIDDIRAALRTTDTKLTGALTAAKKQETDAEDALTRHLDLPEFRTEDFLATINKRRATLGAPLLTEIKNTSSLLDGIALAGVQKLAGGRQASLSDIDALLSFLDHQVETEAVEEIKGAISAFAMLSEDEQLVDLIHRRPFFESGLTFVDGPECPLCDKPWDVDALRQHIREKLAKSKLAQELRDALALAGSAVLRAASKLKGLGAAVLQIAELDKDFAAELSTWIGNVGGFAEMLRTPEGVIGAKDRLHSSWAGMPETIPDQLRRLREKVESRPEEAETVAARDFLVRAEERWTALVRASRLKAEAEEASARGKFAYKVYCDLAEEALTKLYEEVEKDFAKFYRLINSEDEANFKAQFEPEQGKLGLLVDSYGRGMFPPGAYHSEGHQDGMGVCLYLALMKRVMGEHFKLAVLDDVVMSVDQHHRKQFCRLLKTDFPDTQFVITTHDPVWARQMRSEGLVTGKTSVAFHGWSLESGPVLDEVKDVWDRIDGDLKKNEVPTAAHRLRHHLEFVATELAHELAARVHFRADGAYSKNELLDAVIGRQKELLGKAGKAANSWGDADEAKRIADLLSARAEIMSEMKREEWLINPLVHYNEWAVLTRDEFGSVVSVFRRLLEQFRCGKCDSWMYLLPRVNPDELRCSCGSSRLNLKLKQ